MAPKINRTTFQKHDVGKQLQILPVITTGFLYYLCRE